MLRITVHEEPDLVTLKVEGKLKGAWVKELERAWHETCLNADRRSIRADLTALNFVDDRGKGLLVLMRRKGVELLASGPLMSSLIEEVTRRANPAPRSLAAVAGALR